MPIDTETREFATTIFHGARFKAVLPVDVLPDLTAYSDLIVALARHRRLAAGEKPRKRVPKGFEDSFQLVVKGLGAGSTVAYLHRVTDGAPLLSDLMAMGDDFDQARDIIERVVDAASTGKPLPVEFPRELAKGFNRMGRRLRDDEYVELCSSGRRTGARYDKSVRKRIVTYFEDSYEDILDSPAVVDGGSISRGLVTIRLDDRLLEFAADAKDVRQALLWVDQPVRVTGTATYNRDDALQKILWVDDFGLIDGGETDASIVDEQRPSPLDDQIADLSRLQAGWYDSASQALDTDGLRAFGDFLKLAMSKESVPAPYLYPTPDGEARAEWSLPGWEISATADLARRVVHLHATALDSDLGEDVELPLSEAESVGEFGLFFRRLTGLVSER